MSDSRPTQLGITSGDIRDAAGITETADHWHVYLKEWVTIGRGENPEAVNDLVAKFKGRVEDADLRFRSPWIPSTHWHPSMGETVRLGPVEVQCRMWNLVSAWTAPEDAEAYVGEDIPEHDVAGNVRIVGRNTKEEVLLKDYGKKLLPGRVLRGGVVQ